MKIQPQFKRTESRLGGGRGGGVGLKRKKGRGVGRRGDSTQGVTLARRASEGGRNNFIEGEIAARK